jgi:hypothetical protein
MRSIAWDRSTAIEEIRDKIWRYISPAASSHSQQLQACALLQMAEADLAYLRDVHFVASEQVTRLASALPRLIRRLPTTTVSEEEIARERIRGAIRWSRTYAARAVNGDRTTFVTAPARRAFDTPENQLLAFVLRDLAAAVDRVGWAKSGTGHVRAVVAANAETVDHSLAVRALRDVEVGRPTPRGVARVRTGRRGTRFQSVVDVFEYRERLYERFDRDELRKLVERHAFVTSSDPTLLELLVTFRVLEALTSQGWALTDPGVFEGGFQVSAIRGTEHLVVHYQHTPRELQRVSHYGQVQRFHGLAPGGLIPDLVLCHHAENRHVRWILVEVKGLRRRTVGTAARAALQKLFAYRRAFAAVLTAQQAPYGLGVAWGRELSPSPDAEVLLCTPDHLNEATELLLSAA